MAKKARIPPKPRLYKSLYPDYTMVVYTQTIRRLYADIPWVECRGVCGVRGFASCCAREIEEDSDCSL